MKIFNLQSWKYFRRKKIYQIFDKNFFFWNTFHESLESPRNVPRHENAAVAGRLAKKFDFVDVNVNFTPAAVLISFADDHILAQAYENPV